MTAPATTSAVEPWLADATVVAAEVGADPSTGLTGAEAARRVVSVGPNRLDVEPPVPAWRKLLAQFVDPLVFLLLTAVAISLVAWLLEGAEGVPFEAIVIAAILVANAVLGYVQEARAERAVAALQRMAAATSTVLRDGAEVRVPAEEVVPGDVLLLAEGDAVNADGRLFEAASLTVAEAALTGESEPVLKDAATLTGEVALGDRSNMVFQGTAVTRGRGRAIVTSTGMATEMGHIAGLLGRTEEHPPHVGDLPLERGRLLLGPAQQAGDVPHLSGHPGAGDDGPA
ncbi:MAG TPA: cation-transporting P-type ATPase, partial [Acidimicrobiales bacterium]|nr:cation-transporting P-type ATPase [Acidimicrobiales bacterium]